MTTAAYIDLLRKRTETGSDYAVAKLLGISEDAVHGYRKGTRFFDARTALKVADLLGIPLEPVLAVAENERARTPAMRTFWRQRLAVWAAIGLASTLSAQQINPHVPDIRGKHFPTTKVSPQGKRNKKGPRS
jgi:hypothetical protein